MRSRNVGNGLDLLYIEDPEIRQPSVEGKQRIVVGTEVAWKADARYGLVEHPTQANAIDLCGLDAKAIMRRVNISITSRTQ